MSCAQSHEDGFTIAEMVMVMVIMGILVLLVAFTPQHFRESSNAKKQANDTASIIRRLETAYTAQDIGSPSYPSTAELLSDIASQTRTMARTDADIFKAPGSGSSSVIAASTVSETSPAGPGSPTTSQYIYQPLRANGALCTATPSSTVATNRCIRFFFYYRDIATGDTHKLRSLHQQ